jgi:methylmalonyl-CoA/ethylmalonyl-CoA epimerase
MEFHHLGVATADGADTAARYGALFDAPVVHEERVEGVTARFLDLGGGAGGYLELLEPHEPGPVATFLEDRGPGIHHLALRTADLAAALDRVRGAGAETVGPAPRPGAWGSRVAFLHPDTTGGVLVELVEGGGPEGTAGGSRSGEDDGPAEGGADG